MATATATKSITNFTHIHNLSAVNQDKILTQTEIIGMSVGVSIAIVMLLGCCYYACVIARRKKEVEKLELEHPTQVRSRRSSKLEIRAPTTPRAESKV